jgi:hypothetical protein
MKKTLDLRITSVSLRPLRALRENFFDEAFGLEYAGWATRSLRVESFHLRS